MNFSDSMCGLAADISNLASVTGGFGWDRDPSALVTNPADLGAKPIAKNEWLRAMQVAVDLCRAHPHLGRPTPGADAGGFVWLTWERDCERFSLAMRNGSYTWEQSTMLGMAKHTSARLEDVSEALRATLPRRLAA